MKLLNEGGGGGGGGGGGRLGSISVPGEHSPLTPPKLTPLLEDISQKVGGAPSNMPHKPLAATKTITFEVDNDEEVSVVTGIEEEGGDDNLSGSSESAFHLSIEV